MDDDVMDVWVEAEEPWLAPEWLAEEDEYYIGLRESLSPLYSEMTPEQLDAVAAATLARMTPEEAEGFGDFLSKLGRAVAPLAAQVLPIAAPIIGTAIGGPAGFAIGTTVGRLAGQAPGVPSPGPAPSPAQSGAPAPLPTPAPSMGAPVAQPLPTASGSSAAAQLMTYLEDPALKKCLAGRLLVGAGRSTVPVGQAGNPVGFAEFMEALSVLANQAASEAEHYPEAHGTSVAYLMDSGGGVRVGPGVARRARGRASHAASGDASRRRQRPGRLGGRLEARSLNGGGVSSARSRSNRESRK